MMEVDQLAAMRASRANPLQGSMPGQAKSLALPHHRNRCGQTTKAGAEATATTGGGGILMRTRVRIHGVGGPPLKGANERML